MSSVLFKSVNLKRAKVYKNTVSPTQSGEKNSKYWILEPIIQNSSKKDHIMGWSGGTDVKKQIKLKFLTLSDVERYAKKNKIVIDVIMPKEKERIIKSYADNFV